MRCLRQDWMLIPRVRIEAGYLVVGNGDEFAWIESGRQQNLSLQKLEFCSICLFFLLPIMCLNKILVEGRQLSP